MEPLGEYLKDVREEKNLSIDRIIKETHIIKKFIIAIEKDEFTEFPGEAYLKGFLRNYSEYLGLDPNEIIKRYETIKLAEAPTPIEQLIPKPRPNFMTLIVMISIAAVILIGALGYFTYKTIFLNPEFIAKRAEKKQKKENTKGLYTLKEDKSIFLLKKDEKVEITVASVTYFIEAKNIYPYVKIADSNEQEIFMKKDESYKIDLNNDQKNDIELVLKSWNENQAELNVRRITEDELISAELKTYQEFLTGNTDTIFTTNEKLNINFSIEFNSDTYLRYQIDDQPETEALYTAGNQLPVNGKNKVLIWVANAGAVSFKFEKDGKIINPDEAGNVAVKLLYWKEVSNGYALQMSSMN